MRWSAMRQRASSIGRYSMQVVECVVVCTIQACVLWMGSGQGGQAGLGMYESIGEGQRQRG